MDDFEKRYLSLTRGVMTLIGVWPFQPYNQRVILNCILGFILLIFTLLQIFNLMILKFNIYTDVFQLKVLMTDVCALAQYITIIVNTARVKKLFTFIKENMKRTKGDEEFQKILLLEAYYNIICTALGGFCFFCFYSLFFLPPLLRRIYFSGDEINHDYVADRFPLLATFQYFIDVDQFYYIIAAKEMVMVFTGYFIGLASYSAYGRVILHVCGQLNILKYQLRRPFLKNDYRNKVTVKPIDVSHWVIGIIHEFARITDYVKLLNKISQTNFFFQVILAFVMFIVDFLCFFQIPDLTNDVVKREHIYMSVLSVGTVIFVLFIMCHVGQMVIDYSEDVIKEVCMIPFYDLSLKSQKLLLVTLMMNTKPFALWIGKFYVSSHEFFTNMLRTSLSFAMVIHSMKNV